MDDLLGQMRDSVRAKQHATCRDSVIPDIVAECDAEGLSWTKRMSRLLRRQCEAEQPVIEPGQRIAFMRTVPVVPPVYDEEAWAAKFLGGRAHELGPISNICADWGMPLSQGLLGSEDLRGRCRGG